jgi:hypothetical protein
MAKLTKSKLISLLVGFTIVLGFSNVHAFNPATHLFIAQGVFHSQDVDLDYGSISPDLIFFADQEKWPTSFEDTHYNYIDLRSYAIGHAQKAFALGWLTHNELWGADYYAHRINPIGNNTCINQGYYQGYIIEKACLLSDKAGIDPEFAHFAVETAIDFLLRSNEDPELGEKLLNASLFRSWFDRNLLAKVLVWKERRTDLVTLAAAEMSFRNLIGRYAIALALPSPYNKEALARLGAEMALEIYRIEVSQEEVLNILDLAISLCEEDYRDVIYFTINEIRKGLR